LPLTGEEEAEMGVILGILFSIILSSGIKMLRAAKEGVNPEDLQRIAGTKNLKVARIGGWLATIFSASVLLWLLWIWIRYPSWLVITR